MSYAIYVKGTDQLVASLSEADRRALVDALEEEYEEDRDYYVTKETLDYLSDFGLSPDLTSALRTALGDADGIEVEWRPVS